MDPDPNWGKFVDLDPKTMYLDRLDTYVKAGSGNLLGIRKKPDPDPQHGGKNVPVNR